MTRSSNYSQYGDTTGVAYQLILGGYELPSYLSEAGHHWALRLQLVRNTKEITMNTEKTTNQQGTWVSPTLSIMSVRETYTGPIQLPEEAIGAQTGNDLGLAGPEMS